MKLVDFEMNAVSRRVFLHLRPEEGDLNVVVNEVKEGLNYEFWGSSETYGVRGPDMERSDLRWNERQMRFVPDVDLYLERVWREIEGALKRIGFAEDKYGQLKLDASTTHW